jgi:hypothetical protein
MHLRKDNYLSINKQCKEIMASKNKLTPGTALLRTDIAIGAMFAPFSDFSSCRVPVFFKN